MCCGWECIRVWVSTWTLRSFLRFLYYYLKNQQKKYEINWKFPRYRRSMRPSILKARHKLFNVNWYMKKKMLKTKRSFFLLEILFNKKNRKRQYISSGFKTVVAITSIKCLQQGTIVMNINQVKLTNNHTTTKTPATDICNTRFVVAAYFVLFNNVQLF